MKIDLALILTVLAAVTGIVWLFDSLLFAKKRRLMQAEGEEIAEPVAVDYARSLFPIILGVLVLRSFLAEPFRIPSTSMMPTLLVGDFILVNKFAYGLRLPVANTRFVEVGEPARGDVVVFRYPGVGVGDPRVEGAWQVPEGHYFVMGDNRDASADSRVWGFVPEDALVGKAFVIWLNCEKIRNGCTTAFDYSRIGDTIR